MSWIKNNLNNFIFLKVVCFVILILIMFSIQVKSETNKNEFWVKQFGTAGLDCGNSVSIDNNGNIFITGSVDGNLDGEINAGNWDIFLIKYDINRIKKWTRLIGTSGIETAYGVAADIYGNIYITGCSNGNLDGYTNQGVEDIFLIKFDNNGNKIWTRLFGTTSEDSGHDIAIDNNGDIYIIGETRGDLDGFTNQGSWDIFLTKYNSDGDKLWTCLIGTADYDHGRGVAVDNDNNVYITGDVETSIFIGKYDPDGLGLWTLNISSGESVSDYGNDIAVDKDGNIFITGETWGHFAGNINYGCDDIFLIKLNKNGNIFWIKQIGSDTLDAGNGVITDNDGNIYITGYTYGDLDGYTNQGGPDIFLIKYDNKGNKKWTRLFGTTHGDIAYDIDVDNRGNLLSLPTSFKNL